jgi:uncharacterized repeat protein (TIGR01451 family)
VPAGSPITNTATVSGDLSTGNNSDTESTAVITQADLAVSKIDSPDPVNAGFNIDYTIMITNNGASDAQNVILTDPTPPNTTFVSAMQMSGPAFTLITPPVGGTGNVSATFAGGFAAGGTATFHVIVKVDLSAAGTLTNTATVSSATADSDAGNNSDTETTMVTATSELSVSKTDAPDPVTPGDNLVYTITVSNSGFLPAPLVELTEMIPANTTFVSFTAPAGWTTITPPVGGTGMVTATIPSLPGMTSAIFTLVVKVGQASGVTITNTAVVSGDIVDPVPANDSDTETTEVQAVRAPALSPWGLMIALLLFLTIAMRQTRRRV